VSASQIAFGYGGESTLKSYGIASGGRSANINQNSTPSGMSPLVHFHLIDYYTMLCSLLHDPSSY